MSRSGMAALTLPVALFVGMLAAAGASASGPVWAYCAKATPKNTGGYMDKTCSTAAPGHEGRYELLDGIGNGKPFKGTSESATIRQLYEQVEFVVNCSKTKISGSFLAPNKVANVVFSMSKCTGHPFTIHKGCLITTRPLSGELGWIDQAKDEAGLKLTNEAEPEAGLFADIPSCFTKIDLHISGSLIEPWGPVGVITSEPTLSSRTVSSFDEEAKCDTSSNAPSAFEGEEARHILTGEIPGSPPFRCNAAALEGTFPLKGEALMVR